VNFNPYGTGIYGASYTAAAGFYKNLGYQPKGYDGADNDGNGLVDDVAESGTSLAAIQMKLSNHTHKTARAEALYAILVEGQGPLGSTFNADDFTEQEVQDTDGDGLPEFVDAWGEPLQFYRWPIYYHSDQQRGVPVNNTFNPAAPPVIVGNGTMNFPYLSVYDPREQNPLDPSQQLLAPSWWSGQSPFGNLGMPGYSFSAIGPLSPSAVAFSTYFHALTEPLASSNLSSPAGTAQPTYFWDRGSTYFQRRAFFSKFLVISSGPDRQLGIARLDTVLNASGQPYQAPYSISDVMIESQARQTNLVASDGALMAPTDANPIPVTYGGTSLSDAAQDDMSNHNYQAPGGVVE
jgi:hypothetical protein